jgi:hypothetical protein
VFVARARIILPVERNEKNRPNANLVQRGSRGGALMSANMRAGV